MTEIAATHDSPIDRTPPVVTEGEITAQPKAETATPSPEMASTATAPQAPASAKATAALSESSIVESPPVPKDSQHEDDDNNEPQNTLTSLFSKAEWKALKEFRSALPDAFAEAFPEKADAKTAPITLWGITIDPTHPNTDARVSVVLIKFLRARNLNPAAAREMLVNTLRWREEFDIEAALKEEFPPNLFENLAHTFGRDKENRPVIYNVYGGNPDIKSVFSDVQRFLRWRVALQERSVALLDFTEIDQLIQIHDYAGVGLSSRDANSKAAASEATNIFSSHYPEILYKKFFVNVPTLLNWMFWAFKAIVPSATFAKMSVLGSNQRSLKKALLPYIDEKQLPRRYGGEAEAF